MTKLDLKQIHDIEIDGIDHRDAHDYCDAYICKATYKGREMTESELETLDEHHRDFVYDAIINWIY